MGFCCVWRVIRGKGWGGAAWDVMHRTGREGGSGWVVGRIGGGGDGVTGWRGCLWVIYFAARVRVFGDMGEGESRK